MNILFLCTANACRSIMAESIARTLLPPCANVQSAGSQPAGVVHPNALLALQKNNFSTDNLRSKHWQDLNFKADLAITLCADAAQKIEAANLEPNFSPGSALKYNAHNTQAESGCPFYPGAALLVHWPMPDPAADLKGLPAFELAVEILGLRLSALAVLLSRLPELTPEEAAAALQAIGNLEQTERSENKF